jgi:hypothetical protein
MEHDAAHNALYFSGGEILECEGAIVGIGPDLKLYQGCMDVLDPHVVLTLGEAEELADSMIALWQEYRQKLKARRA